MPEFTRGQLLQTSTAQMLGKIMAPKAGQLWPAHDLQCESIWLLWAGPDNTDDIWTPCNCEARRQEKQTNFHKIKVWYGPTDTGHPPFMSMWRGRCNKCKQTWQFHFFGAALGYGLEHQRRARA